MEKIKVHPMVKKSIINFIEKNNINQNVEEIKKISTMKELIDFSNKIKDESLKKFVNEKIEKKISTVLNDEKKEEIPYLQFDYSVFSAILYNDKTKIINTNEEYYKKIYDSFDNKEKLYENIIYLRNKNNEKYDINYYALDTIYTILKELIKFFNVLGVTSLKRKEFIETSKIMGNFEMFEGKKLEYFAISITEKDLTKEQIDYIFSMRKKWNINKKIYNPLEIKTTKDVVYKTIDLISELVEGDVDKIIDLYSYDKAIKLFEVLGK